jgi:hypothetical protein
MASPVCMLHNLAVLSEEAAREGKELIVGEIKTG